MKTRVLKTPRKCGECPFYKEIPYQVHSDRGHEAYCALGYMDGMDMRDRSYKNVLYKGCRLLKIGIKESGGIK